MKINKTILSLIVTTLIAANSVNAQTTNFAGNWTFKDQQSISGILYANGSPKQLAITANSDALTIVVTSSNGDTDSTFTETLGKTHFERLTGRTHKKETSTLTWQADKSGFTEITTIYSKADPSKADYRNTDTWTITNGELLLDRKSENFTNGETWESKATYDKQ
jgi:hypothetical protein